ncbi:biotin/lipoyl-containing protein [Austwickia chelonae]|uniref:biotin/lipoyl-containing protein n=1 Tax=Austwickia chelonae TaxID=100225 RepID=UPI000E236742|nr:acetyl-CoA carboxylase biotin carboxyl carrier protein subunit [Austwickia chelonae]
MRRYTITVGDHSYVIDVDHRSADHFQVQVEGRVIDVQVDDHQGYAKGSVTPSVQFRAPKEETGPATPLASAAAAPVSAAPVPPSSARSAPSAPTARSGGGADLMTAPMPGVILTVEAPVGSTVSRGDTVLVLEAMKMKNALKAPRDGVVAEIMVTAGQQVKYGEALVRLGDG